ncbi:putative nuclease HARBI1 [Merluccius polli]|uniref:Nuclease HARBI1 n=1 Tax=Merluccius polli TaxID=89951 RepID=A0AA47MNV0_MERPO|nr:putative nuclease HARBI1 [Merluccius polli]
MLSPSRQGILFTDAYRQGVDIVVVIEPSTFGLGVNTVNRKMAARRNVLETMEDGELITRYRLNREGIQLVVELVRDAITSPTNRNNPISPEIKCLATLRYLATGKMQLCNANDLGISQPNHQRALLEELTELSSKLVKAEIIPLISSNSLSGFLWTINNYTGSKPTSWQLQVWPVWSVLLTGTHIKIIAPSKDEDVFVNRNKVHSINTQIVFDATFNILDVVTKWPAGSTRDPRILMGSGLRQDVALDTKGVIISLILRGTAHKNTRNVVERGIGQMQRRFHVLHGEIRLREGKGFYLAVTSFSRAHKHQLDELVDENRFKIYFARLTWPVKGRLCMVMAIHGLYSFKPGKILQLSFWFTENSDNAAPDKTVSEKTVSHKKLSDNTASDNTESDNTASDNTASDNKASGNTASDNTSSDNAASNNTSSDNTA